MNPDGTEPTQVTDFYPAYASESSVSADGKYLYFTSNYQSYRSYNYEDIFRLEFKGLKLTRITGMEYVSAKKTGSVAPQITDDTIRRNLTRAAIASFQGSTTYYNVQELIDTKARLMVSLPLRSGLRCSRINSLDRLVLLTVPADKTACYRYETERW